MTTLISEPSSDYFIQLSDVHFGSTHRYPLESNIPVTKSLALALRDDLASLYGDIPPLAIVLSGDLTWTGHPTEFDSAAQFIADLASSFRLTSRNFVVIPGNHDIRWSPSPESYDPKQQVIASQPDAEENFRRFVEETLQFRPNEDLSMGRRFAASSSYTFFDIIGLNSSRLEREYFAGHGFVTRDSFVRATAEMAWPSEPRRLKRRFVAMHHHLLPAIPREALTTIDAHFSMSLDAGEILFSALENEVDVVMHGHAHQPMVTTYSRSAVPKFPGTRLLGVHGAGSVGAKAECLGLFGRNSYTIYRFVNDELIVKIRAASETVADAYDDHATMRFRDNDRGGGLREVTDLHATGNV